MDKNLSKVTSRYQNKYPLQEKGSRCPILINFLIRSNCSGSYNEFLYSYFFNLGKCSFRIFPDSHFWGHTSVKSDRNVFVNMNLVFLLAACAISLVDSILYKYMSWLWSLISSKRVWGSWYLIIWLEITAWSSPMDFWTISFSNWL